MVLDPRAIADDMPSFEALCVGVPWMANLGKPHPRDVEVRRIRDFAESPGPERGLGDWFGRYPAVVRERIEADYPGHRDELSRAWDRVERSVIDAASANVPGAGEGGSWHGPTACVYQAGFTAALVGWPVLLGRPVPDPIKEEWSWLVAGHWPCDYAEEPPGFGDESFVDVPVGMLVVY